MNYSHTHTHLPNNFIKKKKKKKGFMICFFFNMLKLS